MLEQLSLPRDQELISRKRSFEMAKMIIVDTLSEGEGAEQGMSCGHPGLAEDPRVSDK